MKDLSKNWPLLIFVATAAAIMMYGLTLPPNLVDLENALTAPGSTYLLGADHLGRNLFARLAHAGIRDLGLGLVITGLSLAVGVLVGLASGYQGGRLDSITIVIMDLVMSVPHTIMALIIMLYLGYGTFALITALVVTGWVKYARIVRAESFSLRERDFIIYEKYIGLPRSSSLSNTCCRTRSRRCWAWPRWTWGMSCFPWPRWGFWVSESNRRRLNGGP